MANPHEIKQAVFSKLLVVVESLSKLALNNANRLTPKIINPSVVKLKIIFNEIASPIPTPIHK